MSLADAPAIVTDLDTMLRACASYPGGVGTWYPEAPENTTDDHFVLVRTEPTRTPYAEGTKALIGGELLVLGYFGAKTVGQCEALADALLDEITALQTGIKLRGGSAGMATKAGRAKVAGGHSMKTIQISLQYGLSA